MRWSALTSLVGLLIGLLLVVLSAGACSCKSPPPPLEAMEKAAAVFAGKVTALEADEKDHQVRATFEVSRVWKKQAGKTIVVITNENGASCGYTFHEGETYLVYAYEREGKLYTSICARTKVLAHAKDDLDALGDGEAVASTQPATRPAAAKAPKSDFVTLAHIPAPGDVLELRDEDGHTIVAAQSALPEKFRQVLETAKPLDAADKSLRTWAYSPSGSGTFKTKDGTYHYQLFLGGRGQLKTPPGDIGMFAYAFPSTTQPAAGEAAAMPSLRVRIAVPERDAVAVRDERSHFDVVIENVSNQPQKIIDEWNLWGYFSLRFEYTTATGDKKVMEKLPRGWDRNALTTTTLQPGEVMVREVCLDAKLWSNLPVTEPGETSVKIRALFAQPEAQPAAWRGSITSPEQKLTFRKQP